MVFLHPPFIFPYLLAAMPQAPEERKRTKSFFRLLFLFA